MERFTNINAIKLALSSKTKTFISGVITVSDNPIIKCIYKLDNQTIFKKYAIIDINGNEYYISRFSKMSKMINKYKNYL